MGSTCGVTGAATSCELSALSYDCQAICATQLVKRDSGDRGDGNIWKIWRGWKSRDAKPVCESMDNLDDVAVLDSVNWLLPIKHCQNCQHRHCFIFYHHHCRHDHHEHHNHHHGHLDSKVLSVWSLDDPPIVDVLVCVAGHLVMRMMKYDVLVIVNFESHCYWWWWLVLSPVADGMTLFRPHTWYQTGVKIHNKIHIL